MDEQLCYGECRDRYHQIPVIAYSYFSVQVIWKWLFQILIVHMAKDKDLKLDEIHENVQLELGMVEPEALHHLLFLSDLFHALFYLPASGFRKDDQQYENIKDNGHAANKNTGNYEMQSTN